MCLAFFFYFFLLELFGELLVQNLRHLHLGYELIQDLSLILKFQYSLLLDSLFDLIYLVKLGLPLILVPSLPSEVNLVYHTFFLRHLRWVFVLGILEFFLLEIFFTLLNFLATALETLWDWVYTLYSFLRIQDLLVSFWVLLLKVLFLELLAQFSLWWCPYFYFHS